MILCTKKPEVQDYLFAIVNDKKPFRLVRFFYFNNDIVIRFIYDKEKVYVFILNNIILIIILNIFMDIYITININTINKKIDIVIRYVIIFNHDNFFKNIFVIIFKKVIIYILFIIYILIYITIIINIVVVVNKIINIHVRFFYCYIRVSRVYRRSSRSFVE
ncbi:membrane hypothetical protein [Brevibacillus sp. IT-7CA2]